MTSDTLTVEALLLAPYGRAQTAEAMMQSLMAREEQAKHNTAWNPWAAQQSQLVRQGKVKLVDGPAPVAELYQRFQS